MNKHILHLFLLLYLLFPFGASAEDHFSQVVFFGDSLSDTGNVACIVTPPPPAELAAVSFELRRASNGLLAVEHLANSLALSSDGNPSFYLGSNINCSVSVGNNYAVVGATAAGPGAEDLLSQVGSFLTDNGPKLDENALYVLFIGGNDLIAASQNPIFAEFIIGIAVRNISESIRLLKNGGARDFLVVLGPDVGKIPLIVNDQDPDSDAVATAFSRTFNARLQASLRRLERGPIQIIMFDLFGFMNNLLDSGTFTNTTAECIEEPPVFPFPVPGSCTSMAIYPGAVFDTGYFFWDDQHPTASVHMLLGEDLSACFGLGAGSTEFCIP